MKLLQIALITMKIPLGLAMAILRDKEERAHQERVACTLTRSLIPHMSVKLDAMVCPVVA